MSSDQSHFTGKIETEVPFGTWSRLNPLIKQEKDKCLEASKSRGGTCALSFPQPLPPPENGRSGMQKSPGN
jgi:hypothetical protein